MKNFIYRAFKKNRKCYQCDCIDCQETGLRSKWRYCPHIKNNICDICCTYDISSSIDRFDECDKCGKGDKEFESEDFYELSEEEKKRLFDKVISFEFNNHIIRK